MTNDKGAPFFSSTWEKSKLLVQMAKLNLLCDPPGMNLYRAKGVDSYGLTTYKCSRGTSINESFHHFINQRLAGQNLVAESTYYILLKLMQKWNDSVAVTNNEIKFYGTNNTQRLIRINKKALAIR